MSTRSNAFRKEILNGETLIKEGEVGESAYLIESGHFEILIGKGKTSSRINTAGPGTIIGEMALIDDLPRTATVRAITDCVVIEVNRAEFSRRLHDVDAVLEMIMKVILKRYRETLSLLKPAGYKNPPARKVAVVEKEDIAALDAFDEIMKITDIKNALKNDEFILYFQPIVCAKSEKIAGFEALMRWQHPEKGLLFPDSFIMLAETSELISEMTLFALDYVCKAMQTFKQKMNKKYIVPEDDFFVSVNFSVKDLSDETLFDKINETLKKYDVKPGQIHFEVVESLLMEEPEKAKETLTKCQELGLHISIDDFGTGYSSLSYLHSFPFNLLKIDKSFVSKMLHDESSLVLVKAIITLAKSLNMEIIAEGVEYVEELMMLKQHEVDFIQGYCYAKPVPFETACEYLSSGLPLS
mgnify:CR=1 FL=1